MEKARGKSRFFLPYCRLFCWQGTGLLL